MPDLNRETKPSSSLILVTPNQEEGWAAMADIVDSFQRSLAGHRVQNKATRWEGQA